MLILNTIFEKLLALPDWLDYTCMNYVDEKKSMFVRTLFVNDLHYNADVPYPSVLSDSQRHR
jgi:hypothetical protein